MAKFERLTDYHVDPDAVMDHGEKVTRDPQFTAQLHT
jgi:hypothetical protein